MEEDAPIAAAAITSTTGTAISSTAAATTFTTAMNFLKATLCQALF